MKGNLKRTKTRSSLVNDIRRYKSPYIMVLPAIICVAIFSYMPMFGIIIAFKDFDIVDGILGSQWVGLDNFVHIFKNPDLLKAVKNTIIFGVVILFGGFPFPVILALMFNEVKNKAFKKFSQTVAYLPYFLSWISVIGLFYSFLAKEGALNQLLVNIFGSSYTPINPLTKTEYFLPIIFTSHLWKNVGWSSVIYLAAITGIDPTLYEAASVDGCGKWKQTWHITLPCIKSTLIIVLIMSLGGLVNVNFEQVFGFQNAFTQMDTEVIGTLVYREGIQNGKYSLATAFGLMQGIVNLSMVLISNFISKKLSNTSIW